MNNFQRAFSILSYLQDAGVRHMVLSPGSRNAPIMIALKHFPNIKVHLQPDERSAAYIAMGISLMTQQYAVCCCTSGTAVANYYPAIIESYYLQAKLICLTADRPAKAVDNRMGQTIRQNGIFGTYAETYNIEENQLVDAEKIAQVLGRNQPAHINIAFEEPLYLDDAAPINIPKLPARDSDDCLAQFEQASFILSQCTRPLVLIGQIETNAELSKEIEQWIALGVEVAGEPLCNIPGVISHLDLFLQKNQPYWDCVISIGRDWVSKRIKQAFDCPIIHIEKGLHAPQQFGKISAHLRCSAVIGLQQLRTKIGTLHSENTLGTWNAQIQNLLNAQKKDWSDFTAIQHLINAIPANSVVHLGNSSAVRYAMLFPRMDVEWFSNRGTAGIDGSLSTAIGQALSTNKQVYCLLGDISLFYDSNALWVKPENLCVLVINNAIGHIFELIAGPEQQPHIAEWQQSPHSLNLAALSQAFGWRHFEANNPEEITAALTQSVKGPKVIEIITRDCRNAEIFKEVIRELTKH
jgi:2-succinyl-5-enolpyruvyl-6-hydroxy-3-cyclohexene-1-carboxylate synthase